MRVNIERTVQATREAITRKVGKRTYYSPDLKDAIVAASEAIGSPAFVNMTGISPSLVPQWKRSIRDKKRKLAESDTSVFPVPRNPKKETPPKGVRELVVKQDPGPAVKKGGTAVIRSGTKLEIEVPLEILTPNWISGIARALNCHDGGTYV